MELTSNNSNVSGPKQKKRVAYFYDSEVGSPAVSSLLLLRTRDPEKYESVPQFHSALCVLVGGHITARAPCAP